MTIADRYLDLMYEIVDLTIKTNILIIIAKVCLSGFFPPRDFYKNLLKSSQL